MKRVAKVVTITGIVIFSVLNICLILIAFCINDVRKAYRNSGNAIDGILNELQHGKIVAIGESHERVNEQLFIASNIQALYNAGVRYLFVEGGASPEESLPSSEGYCFLMFYPWTMAGWRYEGIALYQALIDFNNALRSDDKIKIISPENVPDYITDLASYQYMSMRDSTAAETIIGIMDAASDGTKAIVWYGDAHTNIYPFKRYFTSPDSPHKLDWLPLGYLLKKHYGDDFSSYDFTADLDRLIVVIPTMQLLDEPKLLLVKNMPLINKLPPDNIIAVNVLHNISKSYDGFIVEPESIAGTFYQYNPTNENLSFIFKIVEDYALECSPDANYIPLEPKNSPGINYLKKELGANFDYASPPTTYSPFDPQGQFMLGLYYLKLYFGDNFDYSFWKTESSKSLLSALAELKDYAFANKTPSEYIRTNCSHDNMILYHKYMFATNLYIFNRQGWRNTPKMQASDISEVPLLQARRMFPEDLWPLYWLGFVATEKKQWEKGLDFFQELFANDLSYSMESLPLAYQKAALCAENLGNRQLADEYRRIAGALYNEYNITVDRNEYSDVGY